MATIIIKDGSGSARYVQASGSGLAASPYTPHHVLSDGDGNVLGLTGSPLVVSGATTQGTAAAYSGAWPMRITDSVDGVAVDSASRLTAVASVVIPDRVSASISNTLTVQASLLNVAVDSASRLTVVASAVIPGTVSASISNTLTASVIQSTPNAIGNAWPMRLTDTVDSVAVDSASRLTVVASAVITESISASISNTVTVAQGTPPWTTRIVDAGGNAYGVSAGSPLYISGVSSGSVFSLSDGTDGVAVDSASRLTVVASAVVTNGVSASISNTLTASAIQGTAAPITAPWSVRMSDGTDSAAIDSASRQLVSGSAEITNRVSASISNTVTVDQASAPWGVRVIDATGNAYGVSAGSPLYITGGAAGGTSATDRAAYAEGTTTYTPAGGLYQPSPAALTASQAGAVRMTAFRALHTSLRDESGNVLGVSGSPLYVTGGAAGGSSLSLTDGTDTAAIDSASRLLVSGSVVIPDRISASISNVLTAQASILNVSIDSASRLQTVASAVITSQVSASISNTLTASAIQGTPAPISAAWPVDITDGTDTIAIDSASRLLVSGSVVIPDRISASISNTLTVQASLLNVAIDSASRLTVVASAVIPGTVSASISNTLTASVIQSTPNAIGNAWPMRLTDTVDSVAVDSASRLTVVASAVITDSVSASISNTVTVAQGTPPWTMRIVDGSGNAYGVSAGSPLYISGGAGGAAGASTLLTDQDGDTVAIDSASRLLVSGSAVITEQISASISNTLTVGNALSASISNTLTASAIQGTAAAITAPWSMRISDAVDSVAVDSASRLTVQASAVVTNGVSASISNTLTASAIQGTPAAYGAAWPMRIVDGTDGAAVTSASGQHVNLRTNTGNEIGVSGSPLAISCDNGLIYYGGNLYAPSAIGFSGSTSGSSVVIAGVSGSQIRVLSMTFTTSSSQFVGWQSGSSGTAASTIPAMGFGNFGGMDVNRLPHGYLLQTGNGSALVISQTTACYVRGSITYIVVPQ